MSGEQKRSFQDHAGELAAKRETKRKRDDPALRDSPSHKRILRQIQSPAATGPFGSSDATVQNQLRSNGKMPLPSGSRNLRNGGGAFVTTNNYNVYHSVQPHQIFDQGALQRPGHEQNDALGKGKAANWNRKTPNEVGNVVTSTGIVTLPEKSEHVFYSQPSNEHPLNSSTPSSQVTSPQRRLYGTKYTCGTSRQAVDMTASPEHKEPENEHSGQQEREEDSTNFFSDLYDATMASRESSDCSNV
ncbi:hypothetical protein F5Y18DRAFT_428099 [Xylariaceae sp. FL1019]|nr:hypothetical protein F5Y18DRAFT_428099 [Xylariaceae sp. FL1019]